MALIRKNNEQVKANVALVSLRNNEAITNVIDRSQLDSLSKSLKTAKDQTELEKIFLSFETTAETKLKFPLYECIKMNASTMLVKNEGKEVADNVGEKGENGKTYTTQ